MIWWTLALFAVSFVLTALLAPVPKIENARPDELNPDTFPRATENAPNPLILGKVRMEAPNTIWYGAFRSEPIKERIRVSLFKKKTIVVGHNYFLSMDLALAMGPRTTLSKIFIDDKEIWSGVTSPNSPTAVNISDSSFFGGHKEGGGFSSSCMYYPGSLDIAEQPIDTYLEDLIGVGKVPAYLGTSHIVFRNAYIGESPQLRKMAFVMENYSNDMALSNNGMIGEDMNPAEAIYQIMTNTWRGMGIDPANINMTKLRALGETLYTEQNGCSILVTAEQNGRQLIQEIMRQIDAIAYQDTETGQINFELIRNDYVVEDLPYFDEDDIVGITSFGRSGWEEVMAQVKITFPQRDRESEAVAISQDMATATMIGRLRSTTLSMPFVYNKALANRIASRERAQLSVPLFNMTIEFNRNANKLRPGGVFRMSWPEYNFSNIIMRVQNFDFGSLLDGKIVVNCMQDKFSLSDVLFAPPPDSGWVEPIQPPTTIINYELLEMPKFLSNILEYPPADGIPAVIPLAAKPQSQSNAFDMISGQVSGALATVDPEYVEYLGSGALTVAYPLTAGFTDGLDTTVGIDVGGTNGSFFSLWPTISQIRTGEAGLLYMGGEWLGYRNATDMGGNVWRLTNVYRGLLGTRPRTHAIGTRIYEVSTDALTAGQIDDIIEGSTIYYKLLDRVGRRLKDASTVVQLSKVLNGNVANRPVRPANAQLSASRTGIVVNTAVARPLTWDSRTRIPANIAFENDGTQTPDIAETYDVDVMIAGVRHAGLSGVGVTSPYNVPFNTITITSQPNCEFRIFARRTTGDLRVSADYAVLPFTMAP